MLRPILLASAGAMALSTAALAADLAPPPPPPPPPTIWTGFYLGLNAGYDWAASSSVNTVGNPLFAAPTWSTELALSSALATGSAQTSPSGFIGGGQFGYNYQFTPSWLAGIEADIQGIAGSSPTGSFSGAGVPVGFPGETIVSTVNSSKSLDYLGTFRLRFGYLVTPTLLVFGSGGLAYGGVNSSTGVFQANLPFTPAFASTGSLSNTQVGWTVGGGFEWMFLPNWSAKVEYLYYDLGKATYGLSPTLGLSNFAGGQLYSSAPFVSTRFNGNVVRAGINYHLNFGPPGPVFARF